MRVTIISCFGYYEQRVQFVKEAFEARGDVVQIYFSDYDHVNKAKIKDEDKNENAEYISVVPYRKNMTIKRLYSHFKFSCAAYKKIIDESPDLVYAIIPPNSLANMMRKYKRKHKVKLIYDIYDLWPESFVNKKIEKLANPFFCYWKKLRNKSIKEADFVLTECDLYQEILKEYIDPAKTKTIYLTKKGRGINSEIKPAYDTLHICYLGSINNIINIPLIKTFLISLQRHKKVVVNIIGKGETKERFIKELRAEGLNVVDHATLYGEDKIKVLEKCHYGINMMVDAVKVGLTMKSVDYIEAGMPLLNNIQGDTWKIVDNDQIGFNVNENTIEEVAEKVASMGEDDFNFMKLRTEALFYEKFSENAFRIAFNPILDIINKAMKKHILFLGNHEVGFYSYKKELVNKVIELGYNVHISAPFEKTLHYFHDELGCDCIETQIDRRGINPMLDLKLIKFYSKIVREIEPDLIFSLTIKPTIYGGFVTNHYKIPFITNITGLGSVFQHDNWLRKIVVLLYRFALKNVRACFFENIDNRQVFLNEKITTMRNSVVVNGAGVNLKEFQYLKIEDKNKIVFAFIGRVMKEKGIDEFFYCVKELQSQNVEFRVYGFCEEEYVDTLKELEKYDNFHYYGFCSDIETVYEKIDCLVLPSYHEGMANVLLEAAATGRILITSNIFGCKETVIDNITGFLVTRGDKDSLLSACKKVLELTYEDRIDMGEKARKLMEEQFDRNFINDRYMLAFNDVLLSGVLYER